MEPVPIPEIPKTVLRAGTDWTEDNDVDSIISL